MSSDPLAAEMVSESFVAGIILDKARASTFTLSLMVEERSDLNILFVLMDVYR